MGFGGYIQNDEGLYRRQAKTDTQGNVLFDDQGNLIYELIAVDAVSSQGDVILKAKDSIVEWQADASADIIADTLDLTAGTGITGLEVTANTLKQLHSTTGNIVISEQDRSVEVTKGLNVESVKTALNSASGRIAR